MLTYKQAYDKIIDAYFKDEIKPMNMNFCFCGTLSKSALWRDGDDNYTHNEYGRMESALLFLDEYYDSKGSNVVCRERESHPDYEEWLFKGMCNALEELKKIHLERGENIDETPVFTKRQLINA